MRRIPSTNMGIDREEKRVTRRKEPSQAWEKAAEQLDTNDPNQRRLSEPDSISGRLIKTWPTVA